MTLRGVFSVIETVGFAVATVSAAIHGGHFVNPWTVLPTLIAFTAHGVNHREGGSPV